MATVTRVTPHVPSTDPALTRDFFVELLGFEVHYETPDYVELSNGACTIGVQRATGPGEPNQQSFYVQVRGLEALWESKQQALSGLRHRAPFVQSYGMKEFHVVAPATRTLVFVGEPVESSNPRG